MLCGYLFIETLRIEITNPSLEVTRWLILFFILFVLVFLLKQIKDDYYKLLSIVICICCVVYYIFYFIQGAVTFYIFNESKYSTQSWLVPGSTYAIYPLLVGLPCGMVLFKHHNAKLRLLGLSVGVLSVIINIYYDSRMLFILLIVFMFISFLILDWKRALIYDGVMLSVWLIMVVNITISRNTDGTDLENLDMTYFETYQILLKDYTDSIGGISQGIAHLRPTDVDRFIEIVAPIKAIQKDIGTLLFGYGTYQHHTALYPYVNELVLEKMPMFKTPEFIRSTGFAQNVTDYGLIGCLLLGFNFLLTGIKLVIQGNKWLVWGIVLCISCGWLIVNNMLDSVLWWMMIIPFGLLYQLNNREVKDVV